MSVAGAIKQDSAPEVKKEIKTEEIFPPGLITSEIQFKEDDFDTKFESEVKIDWIKPELIKTDTINKEECDCVYSNYFICSACSLRCDNEELFLEHIKQHQITSSSNIDTDREDSFTSEERNEIISDFSQSAPIFVSNNSSSKHDRESGSERKKQNSTVRSQFGNSKDPNSDEFSVFMYHVENFYKCPECTFKTSQESHFKAHQLCHEQYSFKCTECSFMTSSKLSLKMHQLRCQGIESNKKVHKCSECPYSTGNKANLTMHQQIHLGEKTFSPFKCSQCSYSTRHKENLIQHLLIHKGEKPYKCSQCSFSTRHKSSLTSHQRIHTRGNILVR